MSISRIGWHEIARICPKETAAITRLLDEYDISTDSFLSGATGTRNWDNVLNIRDCRIDANEVEEAKLEDSLVTQLQEGWDALIAAFESATECEGWCQHILGLHSGLGGDRELLELEWAPAFLPASELVQKGETTRVEFKSTLRA